ncbi:hypothetical protein PC9H_004159 [Pleurotus ostreatus]|uniref:F-box domain-containing protein n=1 Tax=Pleurotus ostreatus TaxID=5322 RepID=A0A8H6ZZQ9_PLEOS|nr:uncharacterized protein PC9H_004159 [Pleurotus ostreatus]KAF7437320.1 hypothetical protein PC9H_004159 [Pleurotus ostreatus]KAJ8703220.1 hypothetical protein PTI98_001862 [Pleurotus ostreatus]
MAADIPIDILDNVLTYVDDGKSELGAFSLVCKSWCTPTRSRMFSTFALNYTVDDLPGFQQCTRLLSLLKDSPHLSQLFRRIELHIHTASPLVHDPILHQLLSYFPNVRTLVLRAFADAWISLPPDLVNSLRLIVCNPLFERLHLSRWRFTPGAAELAHLLSGCTNSLRYLSLTHVSYDVHSGGTAAVDTLLVADLPKLAAMNVFGSSTDGHLPCKIPNLQQYAQVTDISSAWWDSAPRNVVHACIPCDSPLNISVTLRLPVFYMGPNRILQFPNFWEYSAMRSLTLVLTTSIDDAYRSTLLVLKQFFASIPPNSLSHLEELMVVIPFHSPVRSIDWDDGSAWEKATDSLGPLVDVGHLRSVTLALNLSARGTDDVDPLVRHIRSSLLSLDMKGVLKVEPVNDYKLNDYSHP